MIVRLTGDGETGGVCAAAAAIVTNNAAAMASVRTCMA
jgi:hypothetical protein